MVAVDHLGNLQCLHRNGVILEDGVAGEAVVVLLLVNEFQLLRYSSIVYEVVKKGVYLN